MIRFFKSKNYFILVVVIFVFFFFLLSTRVGDKDQIRRACFNDACFNLEIAETFESRALGLMFREHLADDQAMFFIFSEAGNYGFWMKNTLIPLDIIWLNESLEIVFIKHQAQPCQDELCPVFKPAVSAKYVLEIRGGLAEELNLKNGQLLFLER